MEYVELGSTGVKVSPLCLGTMTFGKESDEKAAGEIFHRCREAGINFFDCADVYSFGEAERILGRLIKGCRDELVITSKGGQVMGPGLNAGGLTRRHLIREAEESLRRLGTDRVDIYFLHVYDGLAPMEDALAALDQLVRQGKIVYAGISNWAAWQIAKALGIAALKGLFPVRCLQPMYNLVKRQSEVEILPLAQEERLGVITYGPLGGGLLTGKYGLGEAGGASEAGGGGRLKAVAMYARRYARPEYYQIAQRFAAFAAERGYDPAALAVAWVMAHPAVTAPIIGARDLRQLDSSLGALEIAMTPELRAEVSALSPTPPLATDRLEEQTA